jgi:hypothetical protein
MSMVLHQWGLSPAKESEVAGSLALRRVQMPTVRIDAWRRSLPTQPLIAKCHGSAVAKTARKKTSNLSGVDCIRSAGGAKQNPE